MARQPGSGSGFARPAAPPQEAGPTRGTRFRTLPAIGILGQNLFCHYEFCDLVSSNGSWKPLPVGSGAGRAAASGRLANNPGALVRGALTGVLGARRMRTVARTVILAAGRGSGWAR